MKMDGKMQGRHQRTLDQLRADRGALLAKREARIERKVQRVECGFCTHVRRIINRLMKKREEA